MSKKIISRKSSKYVFTLKNVNTEKVDQKYSITLTSNISSDNIPDNNITKLSELNTENSIPETVSFLDETKKIHHCTISMIDFRTKAETITSRHNCYWCRHPFDNIPIGCPISYVSSQSVKSYFSEISKDMYTIKEDITVSRRKSMNDPRVSINVREYYETDGVFCSFNCCKSFILDNKHDNMYNNSLNLLMKMYNEMLDTTTAVIDAAPHWRTLTNYGGHLSITEFRSCFNKTDYECHGITRNIPSFRSIGVMFEEKIKF